MATRLFILYVFSAFTLGLATQATAEARQADSSARTVSDDRVSQIIVRLSQYEGSARDIGISARQLTRLVKAAAGIELTRFREMSGDARVLALPKEMDPATVEAITDRIARLSGVEYAEPDRIYRPAVVDPTTASPELAATDPRYAEQWHYFELTGGIDLPAAWAITTGDPSIRVAVIDTGILGSHEDLAGQWEGGYDFISRAANARDGDGRDGDPTDAGDWDSTDPSSWHGTHVAGTIAAATNNGKGVAGIAYGAKVVPVRVLGKRGGKTSDIVDAMRWSAGIAVKGVPTNPYPAEVLSLSLGGAGACSKAWRGAIEDVLAKGSVIVVAAGNEQKDASTSNPGNCPGVITVAATNRDGDLAWYSNYGPKVEISAPGGDTTDASGDGVLSTLNTGSQRAESDSYAFYQGTSMATPHVSAVVALMLSANPDLTPLQVARILKSTARPFAAGTTCATAVKCGAGILDAGAAVEASAASAIAE